MFIARPRLCCPHSPAHQPCAATRPSKGRARAERRIFVSSGIQYSIRLLFGVGLDTPVIALTRKKNMSVYSVFIPRVKRVKSGPREARSAMRARTGHRAVPIDRCGSGRSRSRSRIWARAAPRAGRHPRPPFDTSTRRMRTVYSIDRRESQSKDNVHIYGTKNKPTVLRAHGTCGSIWAA